MLSNNISKVNSRLPDWFAWLISLCQSANSAATPILSCDASLFERLMMKVVCVCACARICQYACERAKRRGTIVCDPAARKACQVRLAGLAVCVRPLFASRIHSSTAWDAARQFNTTIYFRERRSRNVSFHCLLLFTHSLFLRFWKNGRHKHRTTWD